MVRIRRTGAIASALIGFACSSNGPTNGVDLVVFRALVYGTVATSGAPVPGAEVVLRSFNLQCGTGPFATDTVTTTGLGQYRQVVRKVNDNLSACIEVRVRPPQGSGLNEAEGEATGIAFLPDTLPLRDSTRVDIELSPLGS